MRRTRVARFLLVVGAALVTCGLLLAVSGSVWLGLVALVAGAINIGYALLRTDRTVR